MEEGIREVLFETCYHASKPYSSNYPPSHQQPNEGIKGSLLSLLSTRGVKHFKEKWSAYGRPQKFGKWISLFVSPRGEYVAVAVGNQITILQKNDDYREPCGLFTSGSLGIFTSGMWSEVHDILGVVDDSDTLYLIKSNGEEITGITKSHFRISLPIIGLVVQDDSEMKKPALCTFIVLTSDGSLHDIDIGQHPNSSVSSPCTSNSSSRIKGHFPPNVVCLDYHAKVSLLAVVSSASSNLLTSNNGNDSCSLSLWQRTGNLDLELVTSSHFEGLYYKPKGYVGQLTSPKVLISLQGKYVASLDLRGCLVTFKLDKEECALSSFHFGGVHDSKMTNDVSTRGTQYLNDIVDFAWWSDHILAVAKRNGAIAMIDILTGDKLLKNDPLYSMPILERAQSLPGRLFVLESMWSEGSDELSEKKEAGDFHPLMYGTVDSYNHFDFAKMKWKLISFAERSVPEMYDIMISGSKYQAALDFAENHGLNKDEVFKSQWLNSCQGVAEINTLLSSIMDKVFVLSECVDRVGLTEDSMRALLAYGLHLTDHYRFSESEGGSQIWEFRLARLKLLQFRDRLETFIGINMGRYSVQEYSRFRTMPINQAATVLAESGKIGALNLLFKSHPYSLSPFILEVLAAIPETVPVQTYGQLLPGSSPPSSIALREEDWVECVQMVNFINSVPESHDTSVCLIRTELIVKQCFGFSWPSTDELSAWYRNRARDIDTCSGQLENCQCLVDFACRRGICELQQFHEDISYLNRLIYTHSGEDETNFTMSLVSWEQLSDYEKFKMMLKGVKEDNVIKRLHDDAIPFMSNRLHVVAPISGDEARDSHSSLDNKDGSFLVRWLKETASENKLDICLTVFEEGSREYQSNVFFRDEAEAVDCALQCVYACSVIDRWSTLASILSKLPPLRDYEVESLKKRLKQTEGHVEAGRLLAFYQVPKPISFFLEAHSDGRGVKQILRLILSKFIRRQPGRLDNDWANMWRDLQSLQEKAFPFLDLEYMLMEFCRGLLKAGKFSLARNYLRGTGSVALDTYKAENLVIQAAREYFFSASSLTCSDIWKAKECLNIFPNSRNVCAEADIIDAVTVKLPELGVNLLPVQFRQIKDPMEVIKLAITNRTGAYLNVDELIEIAKLLGLNSQDEISAVQEAIAREAAVAGDLQLAFDLCLVLAKKGHGPVWDLCAALARGPALEHMDIGSRKQLIGFALGHCDEESIGELLLAWKDLDMQGQCETLMTLTGTNPSSFSIHGSSTNSYSPHRTEDADELRDWSELIDRRDSQDQEYLNNIKEVLCLVIKNFQVDNGLNWESVFRENGKLWSFATLWLPWLLELSRKFENGKKIISDTVLDEHYTSIRTQAVETILSWLACNGFVPMDNLIASLAKSIMESPISEKEDIIGCSFLLNLADAFHGVEFIEEKARTREKYNEICSIMNVGMIYSLLHNSGVECVGPAQRRELMLSIFHQKHTSLVSDERDTIDEAQSSFWREWKLKLEEQKRVADHSRVLEQVIPGVETARFLSGDIDYMESVIFSLIETVKLEKKQILKDLLKLASTYDLNRTKVLLHYIRSVLVSEVWTNNDIMAEVSECKGEIHSCSADVIKIISFSVYPEINGCDKQRLAFIYGLLSDCYLQLEDSEELLRLINPDPAHSSTQGLAHFYKIIEHECFRVSFIKTLNFKNIAGLGGLNFNCFIDEVYAHIDEDSVESLAKMVHTLVELYGNSVPESLLSWQQIYKHHVLGLLTALETRAKTETYFQSAENLHLFIGELETTYELCMRYFKFMRYSEVLDIMKWFFRAILPIEDCLISVSCDSTWQDNLVLLLNFWLRLADDLQEFESHDHLEEKFSPDCLAKCLKFFLRLIIDGKISQNQGWGTVLGYAKYGFSGGNAIEILVFCKSMIFSGCEFEAVVNVFSEVNFDSIPDLSHLYLTILEAIFEEFPTESLQHHNLHHLLSSLSKIDGNLEDLNKVRHTIWAKMVEFSNNLQLPNKVRVYVLELMQSISSTGRNMRQLSSERIPDVLPWEGWNNFQTTTEELKNVSDSGDAPTIFTNTLVALRSSGLISAISPILQVTSKDLLTVGSAVSCFVRLSEASTSKTHVDILISVLKEWEELFTIGKESKDEPIFTKESDGDNNWGNDDWDEGWENFQEEEIVENDIKNGDSTLSVHPLHACWLEILKKLVNLSEFRDGFKLIDQYLSKPTKILLDQDGACSLIQILLEKDRFTALKMALLFPYEELQIRCLDAVEDRLKQESAPETIDQEHELLILVLSSRITSIIVTKPCYGTIFSYICYIVGNLSRRCQEAKLSIKNKRSGCCDEKNVSFIFGCVMFPCFVSELVKAEQHILAGFLVTKFMHTNPSLSLMNVAESNLRHYFERQIQVLKCDDFACGETGFLVNTISSLRGRLGDLIQSALSLLPSNVR